MSIFFANRFLQFRSKCYNKSIKNNEKKILIMLMLLIITVQANAQVISNNMSLKDAVYLWYEW